MNAIAILQKIDELIRSAFLREAQKELTKLKRSAIPRELAVKFSSLCRRASLPSLGVTTLRALVRPTSRKVVGNALPEEVLEYSACLIKLGALREARKLLSTLSNKYDPQVLRVLAAIDIKEWNYKKAAQSLKKCLEYGSFTEYQRQIEKLNLVMCLLFIEETDEAEGLILNVLDSKEAKKHPLLESNALRLLGNVLYQRQEYRQALKYFEKSFETSANKNGMDRFFARKWNAITQYIISGGSAVSQKEIESLRKEALEWRHWESIRDIDYQIASFHRDEKQLVHLYFGTPFQSFRDRIKKRFPALRIPGSYEWALQKGKGSTLIDWSRSGLKGGSAIHRFFTTLCTDFYHPLGTIDIFETIFSNEYYTFGYSEQKVYQIITRSRKWLSENGFPLTIESGELELRLVPQKPCAILVKDERVVANRKTHQLGEIQEKIGNTFTVREAAQLLEMTKRNLQIILVKAVEDKLLTRSGSGTKVVYSFADSEDKKAA